MLAFLFDLTLLLALLVVMALIGFARRVIVATGLICLIALSWYAVVQIVEAFIQ